LIPALQLSRPNLQSALNGRVIDNRDQAAAEGVAVVNDEAVGCYFGGADPIGRRIVLDGMERAIVGVVGNVHLIGGATILAHQRCNWSRCHSNS